MKVLKSLTCFVMFFCIVLSKSYAQERFVTVKQLQKIKKKVLNNEYNVRIDRNNKNAIVYHKSQIDIAEIEYKITANRDHLQRIMYRNKPVHSMVLNGEALQIIKEKIFLKRNFSKEGKGKRKL